MKTIFTTVFYFVLAFSLSAQGEVVSTTFSSPSFDGESFNLRVCNLANFSSSAF